jgi:hypothetical protein
MQQEKVSCCEKAPDDGADNIANINADYVRSVAFVKDGRWVVNGSDDKTCAFGTWTRRKEN